ncbi:MAG: FtsW/RodA/SpoVE family cell cycle protein [Microthrixaceae bacterium]|nr:FtsW/RodA/SpoVE family cell cycle protein [Microthrixaceae bacterium]
MTSTLSEAPSEDLQQEAFRRIAKRRRTTELGLLVLAAMIVCATYALASLGKTASLPADIVGFLAVILGLGLVSHIAVRRLAPLADPLFLPLALLLNGIGYVFIARLNNSLAGLQAGWSAISVLGFVVVLIVIRDVRALERVTYTAGLVGVVLLVMPMFPVIGRSIYGSRIWVRIGPIGFQPGELAKIALAVFFAGYLMDKRKLLGVANFRIGPFNTPDPKHFAPILAAVGVSLIVMVFEKDLGSALLFFILFMVMLWVATGRATYVAVGVSLFAGAAYFAWRTFSHVQTRVTVWIDPWVDPTGKGYQIIQATYALAWGGVTGTGPGLGVGGRIPKDETDFIFAVIGEELGLLGATAIICAFLLLAGSGLRVAKRAGDSFAALLAIGLTALIAFQAFIIVAGVIRLLPLTGVTLPFVSYGGSSLVANYLLLALLIRISDQSEHREQTPVAAK